MSEDDELESAKNTGKCPYGAYSGSMRCGTCSFYDRLSHGKKYGNVMHDCAIVRESIVRLCDKLGCARPSWSKNTCKSGPETSKSYTKSVYVPKNEIERLNRLLDVVYDDEDMEREGVPKNSVLFKKVVRFDDDDQCTFEIRVWSGSRRLWSEAVLYDSDMNEIDRSDSSYEHIDGEWRLSDEDADYTVFVKEKEG